MDEERTRRVDGREGGGGWIEGGWDGQDKKGICTVLINCRVSPPNPEPFPLLPQIANLTFHVLPSWLSPDIRKLLVSSLHSNYNTRCMAERAKELVRHPNADCEWVGQGRGGGCVIFMSS